MSASSAMPSATLGQRLGGPRAVSLAVYLVAAPYFVLSVPINEPGVIDHTSFAAVLLVSVAGYLAFGVVLLIAAATVLRSRRQHPSPVWLVLLVILLGAEARVAVLVAGLRAAGVENTVSTPVRLLSGGIIALMIFPALTYAQDSWDRFRTARDELLQRRIAEQQQILRHSEIADELRSEVIRRTRGRLDPTLTRVQRSLDRIIEGDLTDDDARESIMQATDVTSAALRHTSRELWRDSEPPPTLSLSGLIAVMARRGPYSPALALPIAVVLYWRFFDRFWSIGQAASAAGAWLGFAIVVAVVTNWACRRNHARATATFLGSVVALATPALIPLLTRQWLPERCGLGQWVFALLCAALVMALWGAPGGIASSRRLQLQELQQSIQSAQVRQLAIEQEVIALHREMSMHLHGTVQSGLAIALVHLQQTVEEGDDEGTRAALSRAQMYLDIGTDLGFPTEIRDIREHLTQLAESWRGICDIDVDVEGQPSDVGMARTICRVVTEAINDAVRHGEADHIDVRITMTKGVCDLSITDNGHLVDETQPGLGSRILSEASPGTWRRSVGPNGHTLLRATLT